MDATIPCVCPDARHETDTITFRDRLDFRSGLAIRKQVKLEKYDTPDMSAGEILALLTEFYILLGVESWTLVDDKGKPVPVTRETLRSFLEEHQEEAEKAGSVADDTYQEQVLLPLLEEASTSSRPSRTPASTSPTRESSKSKSTRPRRRRSKPSSITSIPTGDTTPTMSPPDGDYRSLRNSA